MSRWPTLLVSVCTALRDDTALDSVALSGGVFQNRLLLELALPRFEAAGLRPLLHRLVPANDGGVSLGQAYVAHYARNSDPTTRPAQGLRRVAICVWQFP